MFYFEKLNKPARRFPSGGILIDPLKLVNALEKKIEMPRLLKCAAEARQTLIERFPTVLAEC